MASSTISEWISSTSDSRRGAQPDLAGGAHSCSGGSISRLRILPVGPFGKLVDEPDLARVLVGGDLVLDELAQLFGARLGAVLERDRGADLLAVLVVGHAEHRGLAHGRVLVEDLLDLARVDVVAAADDHVLLAVDDEEVAVLVDGRHVAGVQPAVADRLGGRVGRLQ